MDDSRRVPEGPVAAFRAELLRWNRQINLVSRRDTAQVVDDLLRQCEAACSVLLTHVREARPDLARESLVYCDVGSGGGLPGFVWHGILGEAAGRLQSWLIEPREKRAWFLQRVARLHAPEAYTVLPGRWGEVTAPGVASASTAVISLKALHLSDPEVLAGFGTFVGPALPLPEHVVIARFRPAAADGAREPGPDPAVESEGGDPALWRGCGVTVLNVVAGGREPVSLVVSSYSSRNS